MKCYSCKKKPAKGILFHKHLCLDCIQQASHYAKVIMNLSQKEKAGQSQQL